jgi:hypothetical protein
MWKKKKKKENWVNFPCLLASGIKRSTGRPGGTNRKKARGKGD